MGKPFTHRRVWKALAVWPPRALVKPLPPQWGLCCCCIIVLHCNYCYSDYKSFFMFLRLFWRQQSELLCRKMIVKAHTDKKILALRGTWEFASCLPCFLIALVPLFQPLSSSALNYGPFYLYLPPSLDCESPEAERMFYLFPGHSSVHIIGPDKHLLICMELKFSIWKSHLNWRIWSGG